MTLRVEFHPAAEDEILTALSWYAERSTLAASAFLHEVNLVVERMTEGRIVGRSSCGIRDVSFFRVSLQSCLLRYARCS
jgi:hypothetical protein